MDLRGQEHRQQQDRYLLPKSDEQQTQYRWKSVEENLEG